jgi:NAD+ kinase
VSTQPSSDYYPLRRIGLVVHPIRDIHETFQAVRSWSDSHDVEIVQVPVLGQQQELAPEGEASGCDVIVAIGGDGTTLAAIRAAAAVERPVLGVACGSLGALTGVASEDVLDALERFSRGEWKPYELPGLEILFGDSEQLTAFNDLALVRGGEGQARTSIHLDGVLYARLAGDGCVVSTAIGSSAYSLAAGGPLLAPGAAAFLLTPLPTHGGSCPPLVVPAGGRLELEVRPASGGVRLEVDGKVAETYELEKLTIEMRSHAATIVGFDGQESLLGGLRRRGIIIDSPRILAEDQRERELDQA